MTHVRAHRALLHPQTANGQQFEAQFIEKDWAREYIYKDETNDCFTIKETKICQWGK